MSRLIMISNRLPVSVSKENGELAFHSSVGGVATGIASLEEPKERLWMGWPGLSNEQINKKEADKIKKELKSRGCIPLFLSDQEIEEFYAGFSNKTIWPLFHYFSTKSSFTEGYWNTYKQVNQAFCDEIIKHIKPDDQIWIHDYQLMLLPGMLREKMPDADIGFFLHIPFPTFELIRHLPWRYEILEGILGADLVGFHEYDYVRHFLSSVYRIAGHEHHLSELVVGDRLVRVDAFPMGIDYTKFSQSGQLPEVKAQINNFINEKELKLIISVDRLDYTKGILERLNAYNSFLLENPEYHEKVSLMIIAVPSRTKVDDYADLRDQIEVTVGRINGQFSTVNWTPIQYLYRSLPFDQLAALYNIADIALITPLRDGMNLVAKEFVACQEQRDHQGVLILSEMAGAASELGESIVINPFDHGKLVNAIKDALEMPDKERSRRNKLMQKRLSRYTVGHWAEDFLKRLKEIKNKQEYSVTRRFIRKHRTEAVLSYATAKKRLLLFDYDGTLVPFFKLPEQAFPDDELLAILEKLTSDERNQVVIISGRDKDTLDKWVGHLPLALVVEHGAYIRKEDGSWETTVAPENDWKDMVRPVLELYVDRTPGSFIEEKVYSLVWHCRKSEPDLAKLRIQEVKNALVDMTSNLNIGVFEGNKIVEVKDIGANKGQSIINWAGSDDWDFIFCAGDDYTDEDMFNALPERAVSCKIGMGPSNAVYRLDSPFELRTFLKSLVDM